MGYKNIKNLRIRVLTEGCEPVANENGDWIDLLTAKGCILHPGSFECIPLGIAVELPEGYEAFVVMRSSSFNRYGIIQTNAIGIIDNSYCGDNDEWKIPVYSFRDVFIPRWTRIAQFRIIKNQPLFSIEYVDKLGNKDRNGFGSTGV